MYNLGAKKQSSTSGFDSILSNEQTTESDDEAITKKFKVKSQHHWQGLCFAISIKGNTLAVGSRSKIFIFNTEMELEQELFCHSCSDITQLNFMKNIDCFVSIGYNSLIIWKFGNLKIWISQKNFKDLHSNMMNQFANNDNLIITCGRDGKIIFIERKLGDWKVSQIINQYALSIAMNQSGNQVAAYSIDKSIMVYYFNHTWKKFQRIQLDQYGYSIGYINDQIIAAQPLSGSKLEFFRLKDQNFVKYKDMKLPIIGTIGSSTGMQIQKATLICQNNRNVEVIQIYNKKFFGLEESIHLSSLNLCFAISQDEKYLIIWDGKVRRFEVRIKQ